MLSRDVVRMLGDAERAPHLAKLLGASAKLLKQLRELVDLGLPETITFEKVRDRRSLVDFVESLEVGGAKREYRYSAYVPIVLKTLLT